MLYFILKLNCFWVNLLLPAQVFTRFVEIGRVAYVSFGPHAGKLVAIVDVIDQNRVSGGGGSWVDVDLSRDDRCSPPRFRLLWMDPALEWRGNPCPSSACSSQITSSKCPTGAACFHLFLSCSVVEVTMLIHHRAAVVDLRLSRMWRVTTNARSWQSSTPRCDKNMFGKSGNTLHYNTPDCSGEVQRPTEASTVLDKLLLKELTVTLL